VAASPPGPLQLILHERGVMISEKNRPGLLRGSIGGAF
jgi:hypothetical protein